MKRVAALLFALCLPLPAAAGESGPPAPLVEAIARHESGLNPLAVNVAGKSYYPATRQEAEAIIQAAQAAGQPFDVGLMQVNNWWIERYGIPPASLLDPAVNRAWGGVDSCPGDRPARLQLAGRGPLPLPGRGTGQALRLAGLLAVCGHEREEHNSAATGEQPCRQNA